MNDAGPRLSCIIPAYNEAPRIGAVIRAVLATPEIGEVIVVDDGSTDATASVVEGMAVGAGGRLRLLRQAQNGGKTRAVASGVAVARGEHLMLIDSDLVGLSPAALSRLAAPVLDGRAGASISLRGNAPRSWRLIGLDYISGERVMARRLLADRLDALDRLPRFGLEVFMNGLWLDAGLKIAVVDWPEVASPMKAAKRGGWVAGLKADAAMIRDILRTIPPLTVLRQIQGMRARRV
ncbi:MAG: glycosyltransferase family 2 protein [Maritimibacter sp.]|nr:glycosyltransferase family 2 protein [Maritimibacter sp.]